MKITVTKGENGPGEVEEVVSYYYLPDNITPARIEAALEEGLYKETKLELCPTCALAFCCRGRQCPQCGDISYE